MESDLKAAEDAEGRLEVRSSERRAIQERRDRRRRLAPWLLCLVPLPALGAAACVALLDRPGSDLLGPAACLLVPALLSGWIGRYHGRLDAVLWALITAAVALALVVGVGFVALGHQP